MKWKELIGGVVVLMVAALVFVLFGDKGAIPVALSLVAIGTNDYVGGGKNVRWMNYSLTT